MGGIQDHSPGIWDHNLRDRDQRCVSLDQDPDQASLINKILRDKGSKIWVKLRDQR